MDARIHARYENWLKEAGLNELSLPGGQEGYISSTFVFLSLTWKEWTQHDVKAMDVPWF